MKAVVTDTSAKSLLKFVDIDEPQPLPNQALIEVKAISLNRGEVHFLPRLLPSGSRIGWDFGGGIWRCGAGFCKFKAQIGGKTGGKRVVLWLFLF